MQTTKEECGLDDNQVRRCPGWHRHTDSRVRAAAAASLRELVETLPPEPALRDGLAAALPEADPAVRAAALDVLRALRLGDAELFAGPLSDPDIAVRIAAVRALVSVDAAAEVSRAASVDPSREVRVTIAKALASLGARSNAAVRSALASLVDDPDALVRGAAYEALGTTGCPAALAARAEAALSDPAWQVRPGAATALSAADSDQAVPVLAKALTDLNADVRKAAVLALTRHRAVDDARTALAAATTDADTDVRAYAMRAL